jgi:hypothetical protein
MIPQHLRQHLSGKDRSIAMLNIYFRDYIKNSQMKTVHSNINISYESFNPHGCAKGILKIWDVCKFEEINIMKKYTIPQFQEALGSSGYKK